MHSFTQFTMFSRTYASCYIIITEISTYKMFVPELDIICVSKF